eukprot:6394511-Amphidinium_carterae.1
MGDFRVDAFNDSLAIFAPKQELRWSVTLLSDNASKHMGRLGAFKVLVDKGKLSCGYVLRW